MKSIANVGNEPAGTALLADDLLEFHAARLLLLLHVCGTGNHIDGLTKMAKLDFFVRYPDFFEDVSHRLGGTAAPNRGIGGSVESSMVRHHYGPWDRRYYHVLSYLTGKALVEIKRIQNYYRLSLTSTGAAVAAATATKPSFAPLVAHMKGVKRLLGAKSGSALKDLVYEVFKDEVAHKELGDVIR
jgi:hypothetical protein